MKWHSDKDLPREDSWYLVYVPESMGHIPHSIFMCRFRPNHGWFLPYENLTVALWMPISMPWEEKNDNSR